MKLSNIYNFRNPVRHFVCIDHLEYPEDILSFDPINELCWTKPIAFQVYKSDDCFRTIKMPNILNFVRAYYYYKGLPEFDNVMNLDPQHKRLAANLDTGDFVSGNYDLQLNDDFISLCNYDILLKLDISEYYGRIYTHYLDLDSNGLRDNPLAWLNYGRTSGILMGNYLSLYFAEYLSSQISKKLEMNMESESVNCTFNYFSDDFYFFCNKSDEKDVLNIFDKVLAEFDFTRKEKEEIWTYESYNAYNLLTRYWKSTIRTWNLDVLKEYERQKKFPDTPIIFRYSFLNQLVYRLSSLQDEKSKRGFITYFFKTHHFQTCDYSNYAIRSYDLHQLLFLVKSAPESLLYISHIITEIEDIKTNSKTKDFLKVRYKEALKHELHDVQLYYYYALQMLGFSDVIQDETELIIKSQNQVLISYYLKDKFLSTAQINLLKSNTGEEYWFQNYHLIMYTPSLKSDLDNSIKKYLIPEKLAVKPNTEKENRYLSFYRTNIQKNHALINEIDDVTTSITGYLELRYKETAEDFED